MWFVWVVCFQSSLAFLNCAFLLLLLLWNLRTSLASSPSAQIHLKNIKFIKSGLWSAFGYGANSGSRSRTRPNVSQIIHDSGPTCTANPSKLRTAFSIIIQLKTQHLSEATTAATSHSEPEFTELEVLPNHRMMLTLLSVLLLVPLLMATQILVSGCCVCSLWLGFCLNPDNWC